MMMMMMRARQPKTWNNQAAGRVGCLRSGEMNSSPTTCLEDREREKEQEGERRKRRKK